MNHYEITAPSFNFTGGATALSGGVAESVLLELARQAGPRPWASFIRLSPTEGAPHG